MPDELDNASLRTAGRIADGKAVDWAAADADPGLSRRLEAFRLLERVASTHRAAASMGQPVMAPAPSPDIETPTDVSSESPAPGQAADPGLMEVPAGGGGEIKVGDLPTSSQNRGSVSGSGVRDRGIELRRWGSLRISEMIGAGGFGVVYRAHDPILDKEVALKLLRPERAGRRYHVDRFVSEARKHARVRHQNVLLIHGADQHGGRAGLWTELISGQTLEELLGRQGRLGAEEATQIGLEMCAALAAVHSQGLVHRDVKTSNIMRREGGGHVLMDFSAASKSTDLRSASGSAVATGTPLFMAPEIFEGAEAGPPADLYSLGVVLYRLVSGRYPVSADSMVDLHEKHRRGESVPLRDVRPDLPAAFIRVVERALAPSVRDRYQSAGEFERGLQSFLSPGGGSARSQAVEPKPHESSWTRFFRGPSLAAMASVAAAALAVVLFLTPGRALQAEASLFRYRAGAEERLSPGMAVAPGDHLFLEIHGSRAMHVYVLDQPATGEPSFLFPVGDQGLENPLAGGVTHRLPGEVGGVPVTWTVSSAGGRERILVIASVSPLGEIEELSATIPVVALEEPREGDPVEAPGERLRGIQHLTPREDARGQAAAPRPLDGLLPRLADRAAGSSGLWLWEIELDNPGGAGLTGSGRP